MIVLDASLTIEWLFAPPSGPMQASSFDALFETPVIVPSHWPVEISNTLRPDLHNRKLPIADLHAIMDRLGELDIRVEQPTPLDQLAPLAQFAVTHGLTCYDAAYLRLAIEHQATLATLDDAKRRAATTLNIPLLPV